MKVAIFFDTPNFTGGIFHQTLNTVNNLKNKEFSEINYEILVTPNVDKKNFENFEKKLKIFKSHKYAERFYKLTKSKFIQLIFKKFKIINPFEKFIRSNNYDLILFLSPTKYIEYCGECNFIVNLFDFNHRIENSFPEYRKGGIIDETDSIIFTCVKKAFIIFVNSSEAKKDLKEIFRCPDNKISLLNYYSNLINIHKEIKQNEIDRKNLENKFYNLGLKKNENIFFYPAQFWPHKNHKYLIDVAKILFDKKINFQFIFCGTKKINHDYIVNQIEINKLQSKIMIFDYLEDIEIISLYLNCLAVIMPTYVGRSSLPLIESFYFKKTIFYSKGILDKEIEEYVNTFDLKNPNDLAEKIQEFLSDNKINFKDKKNEAFQFFLKNFQPEKSNQIIFDVISDFKYLKDRWKK